MSLRLSTIVVAAVALAVPVIVGLAASGALAQELREGGQAEFTMPRWTTEAGASDDSLSTVGVGAYRQAANMQLGFTSAESAGRRALKNGIDKLALAVFGELTPFLSVDEQERAAIAGRIANEWSRSAVISTRTVVRDAESESFVVVVHAVARFSEVKDLVMSVVDRDRRGAPDGDRIVAMLREHAPAALPDPLAFSGDGVDAELQRRVRSAVREARERLQRERAEAEEADDGTPRWVREVPREPGAALFARGQAPYRNPAMARSAESMADADARRSLATALSGMLSGILNETLAAIEEADPARDTGQARRAARRGVTTVQNVAIVGRHHVRNEGSEASVVYSLARIGASDVREALLGAARTHLSSLSLTEAELGALVDRIDMAIERMGAD